MPETSSHTASAGQAVNLPDGYGIRKALPRDSHVIARQRGQMFVDMGRLTPEGAAQQLDLWTQWLAQALSGGQYVGFLAEQAGQVVGGVGLMFPPKIPTTTDPALLKGHILNMSVDAPHRRLGLAEALMHAALDELRERGIRSVSLNAAPLGQGIYARLGFIESTSPEMRLTLEES